MFELSNEQKEEFLKSIYSIPDWVESTEDLFKYSMHLMYRLIQQKDINRLVFKELRNYNESLCEELAIKANSIKCAYDKVYNNERDDELKNFDWEKFFSNKKSISKKSLSFLEFSPE